VAAKKKAPARQGGGSTRGEKAASKRMTAEANALGDKKFNKWFVDYVRDKALSEKYVNFVGTGEGGEFTSSGLQRKEKMKRATADAKAAKTASQQMKQGVTKSGGYAGPYLGNAIGDARRAKRSDKFKAETAVKKTGSMTRNAKNKKKNAK
jgi:hypothetical protein